MIFDIDSDTGVVDWVDNVPFLPAYFVGKRLSGQVVRPHALIKLEIPVDLTKRKQTSLYYAVRAKIGEMLAFGGSKLDDGEKPTTKNPNATQHWSVIPGDDRLWTLDELRVELDLPSAEDIDRDEIFTTYNKAHDYFNLENARMGRENMLFESMRGLAYVQKPFCASQEQLFDYVLSQAVQFDSDNNIHNPLRFSAIKATAHSISKWTWRNYAGSGNARDKNIGACQDLISPTMPKRQRQVIGGQYGASKNAEKHEKIVRNAIAGRSDYTISGLAKELAMSRDTVRKYVGLVQDIDAEKQSKSTREGVTKTVLSGIGFEKPLAAPTAKPTVKAERDGEVWDFREDPVDPDYYIDASGIRIPVNMVEPYVIWRAEPPLLEEDIPF